MWLGSSGPLLRGLPRIQQSTTTTIETASQPADARARAGRSRSNIATSVPMGDRGPR
jgi:hypothetical protein